MTKSVKVSNKMSRCQPLEDLKINAKGQKKFRRMGVQDKNEDIHKEQVRLMAKDTNRRERKCLHLFARHYTIRLICN